MRFFRTLPRKLRTFLAIIQPLTVSSSKKSSPVSDLFIWRNDKNWKTYFRLVNQEAIVSGPGVPLENKYAIFIYFSHKGIEIKRTTHAIPENHSALISVSQDLASFGEAFGTFCVIHSGSPKDLDAIGCKLTERGYVGYSFRNSQVLSYAHGNLDAVAISSNGKIEMLGGTSLLKREYRLQYSFNPKEESTAIFVNPYKAPLKIDIKVLRNTNANTSKSRTVFSKILPSLGCAAIVLPLHSNDDKFSIVVNSKLCMARPMIFTNYGASFNVFHG